MAGSVHVGQGDLNSSWFSSDEMGLGHFEYQVKWISVIMLSVGSLLVTIRITRFA